MEENKEQEAPQYVPRDVLARMEILAMLAATVLLMVLALLRPAPLGERPDPLSTPVHVGAPWIFAWIQELLRHFPALIGGVLVPLAVFLLILLIPFLRVDETVEGAESLKSRILPLILLSLSMLVVIVMTFMHFSR
jgi:quinol-cytochrome oxidoreductase complex cytochrome b subunit